MDREVSTLAYSLRNLESALTERSLPYSGFHLDYCDFFAAFAVLRGVLDHDNHGNAQSYDMMHGELASIVQSVDCLRKSIVDASLRSSDKVRGFLRRRIAMLRRRRSQYPQQGSSLGDVVVGIVSSIDSDEQYVGMLCSIGRELRQALGSEPASWEHSNRLSPNYMAEISAVYSVLLKYREG